MTNAVIAVPMRRSLLLALLGCLTAMEVAAIDVYMPALPRLQQVMQVSTADAGLTLSVFLAGIAVGQAICGPLSDRYGRRRPLIVGLSLYTAASAMPLLLTSFGWFLLARMLQALGAAAGLVISRAVVTDCYDDDEAPRIYSILMQILGMTATGAPLLGGYLVVHWDWPSIVMTLTAVGGLCLLAVAVWMKETLPASARVAGLLSQQLAVSLRLARDRRFAAYTLALAATMAAMFNLLAGSSFVVIQQLGWTPLRYSQLYGLGAFGFIVTGYVNTRALSRRSPNWLLWRSVCVQAAISAALLLMASMRTPSALLFAVLMTLFLSNLGFISGNLNALAMARARASAGAGSAMIGVLQFAVSAAAGGVAATIGGLPIGSTSWTLALFSAAALISYCIGELPHNRQQRASLHVE